MNKEDWFKIRDNVRMVKTRIKFRPYRTDSQLLIRGRAKVRLTAKVGAEIETWVYINDDGNENSLLGKRYAIRLGIVNIGPEGMSHKVTPQYTQQ